MHMVVMMHIIITTIQKELICLQNILLVDNLVYYCLLKIK